MKNKTTAGIFALLFGHLGIHRFYLGERKLGRLYLLGTFLLFFLSVQMEAPIVLAMLILSFIDGVLLLSMGREEFNEKYNQRYLNAPSKPTVAPRYQAAPAPAETPNPWKVNGIEKFKDFDYEGALEDFKQSLTIKYDDPAVHFNLACCYSLCERPDPAFFHLTKAVHFGFVDFDKIEGHEGLSFLRTQPEFRDFVKKGYQLHSATPEPVPDLLAQTPSNRPSLLDQIKRLTELREQGILTEEEYMGMKQEVLRG
jgi:TM2 domain-containing membrane protein YozV